ncbi:MAG: PilZ domain-containing protein [Bdellovibrionales bacterium]|nr:PilZ domain-containing protein [Bdellovibrionales bacterium]
MAKLQIVGKDDQTMAIVEHELSALTKHFEDIHFFRGRPGYIGTTIAEDTTILVYDAKEVNKYMQAFVKEARRANYEGPIVILGKIPETVNIETYLDDDGIVFIEKPYEVKDLVGIVWKYLTMMKVKQRQFRRYEVREKAIIETYNSDYKADTTIHDISKGGMRVIGDHIALKAGDLLRIHFNFDQIQKERVMSAKVVWVKKKDDNTQEAGLQFVSQKAVYQYLLNYALN